MRLDPFSGTWVVTPEFRGIGAAGYLGLCSMAIAESMQKITGIERAVSFFTAGLLPEE
jgi:hypothetical protein